MDKMKYMVTYRLEGSEHVYGYAASIGEAIEFSNECREYYDGQIDCGISAWDEITGQWVRIN
jgi:hypothetical protein